MSFPRFFLGWILGLATAGFCLLLVKAARIPSSCRNPETIEVLDEVQAPCGRIVFLDDCLNDCLLLLDATNSNVPGEFPIVGSLKINTHENSQEIVFNIEENAPRLRDIYMIQIRMHRLNDGSGLKSSTIRFKR